MKIANKTKANVVATFNVILSLYHLYLAGKKEGEYCGTSLSYFGEVMSHGTCEEGLICDEPTQAAGQFYTSPGKCKRSGENK